MKKLPQVLGRSFLSAALLAAGCYSGQGLLGADRSSPSGSGGSGSAGNYPTGMGAGSATGAGSTANAGMDAGTGTTPPLVPFDPLPVVAQVTKVKNLLTGLTPTQAELDQVTQSASALPTLIDTWLKTPQYATKIALFFDDAFQQSQARPDDFRTVIDDGRFTPNEQLFLNMRQMFSRTVMELQKEGHPFTEAVTTRRYMMTTALMTYFAFADTSMTNDKAQSVNRFLAADPNWSWSVTAKGTPIPLTDSVNPNSPNYLKFYEPNLMNEYGNEQKLGGGPGDLAYCNTIDPVVFTNALSFSFGGASAAWLMGFLSGSNFWTAQPNVAPKTGHATCYHSGAPTRFIPADYTDWRMVEVTQISDLSKQTKFFDLPGNRQSSSLNLFAPRVGYFTSPVFFAQYPTNTSNQARGISNQTMIVGLNQAIDGSDAITVKNPVGLDPEHASDPACFQCHWNLDPLRHFFRSTYTLNYDQQQDTTESSVTGTLLFDNVVGTGHTLYDLADEIATHPRFKLAWAGKLCAWANSGPCLDADPELVRIANDFASSNYDFNTLVRELFSSPIVTYASPTLTTQTNGAPVAIARRAQLCATLGNRLGLTDVCGLQALPPGVCTNTCPKSGTVPMIGASLPSDGYSRGAVNALYVNDPDPFYSSAVEQICSLVADQTVDTTATTPLFSSKDPPTAIAAIVHRLLGLDKTGDAEPISILTDHYNNVIAQKSTPTVALKATFVTACISPWVVSVGQGM